MSNVTLDDLIKSIGLGCSRSAYHKAARAVAERFARLNNWELLPPREAFSLKALGQTRRRGRVPHGNLHFRDYSGVFVALVMEREELGAWDPGLQAGIARYCRDYSVVAHTPPLPHASFDWPTKQILVLFTKPGIQVEWLPEQIEPSPLFERIMEAQKANKEWPWKIAAGLEAS
jgi:hypothetical protein